ncbi:hypothetical protein [Pseudoalteromonas sp. MER144-MNA-CIBAN-0113]|uniref:hypothetical protein n=1 Tax=Pseudoalteromonas sp. MER144-MNA-CIBAN-0113 TaxID=3140429 RepID=UPI003328D466
MRNIYLLIFVLFSFHSVGKEYYIDEYEFKWVVTEFSGASLAVIKTDETTYLRLTTKGSAYKQLRLTEHEAKELSIALQKTREYFNEQKGTTKDVSAKLMAAEYEVSFSSSPKYGFSVYIRKKSGSLFDSIILDKAEAIGLQPYFEQAEELINFVDTKIKI